jgi:hypothetical protein
MPPKRTQEAGITSEQIDELLSNQKDILSRLSIVEELLKQSQAENAILKSENVQLAQILDEKNAKIDELQLKHNKLEQYNRSWSVRILGVPIPQSDANNNILVMKHVYDLALLPILKGAEEKGLIQGIPTCAQLLETAHILPGKNDGKPKAIIARFFSRNLRTMIFQLKKDYAPKDISAPPPTTARGPPRGPKLLYPIYEDLTKDSFNRMKKLLADPRTGAVWSMGGIIKFKMANGTDVKKVTSVYDDIEEILK